MDLFPLHDLTDRILRCAIAVHKELGPGLPEYSYQTALGLEMDAQRISYVSDRPLAVRYRGVVVGWHRPDFIVEQSVVVEIRASDGPHPVYAKQVLTYLKVTKLKVGLLLNFNVPSMGGWWYPPLCFVKKRNRISVFPCFRVSVDVVDAT